MPLEILSKDQSHLVAPRDVGAIMSAPQDAGASMWKVLEQARDGGRTAEISRSRASFLVIRLL